MANIQTKTVEVIDIVDAASCREAIAEFYNSIAQAKLSSSDLAELANETDNRLRYTIVSCKKVSQDTLRELMDDEDEEVAEFATEVYEDKYGEEEEED